MVPNFIYCGSVWNPAEERKLKCIENASKKFWKMNPNGGVAPPEIDDPTLLLIMMDVIYLKKIKSGKTPHVFEELFKNSTNLRNDGDGDGDEKIFIPHMRLEVSKSVFSYRVRKFWNIIPKEIRDLPLHQFKIQIKVYIRENSAKFIGQSRRYKSRIEDSPEVKIRPVKKLSKSVCDKKKLLTTRLGGNKRKRSVSED